jgi:opacity protein-like surface antigen
VDETIFLTQQENRVRENGNLLNEQLTDSIQHTSEESKADSTQSHKKEEAKKSTLPSPRTFYLRLLASPDFSSINYTPVNSVGSNYSVLVDYQLTNRWSISTGAIWSMKTYSSDDEFTYGAYTADRMAGDCRVLDIPLNIYYQFPSHSRFSFYSGLGVSSYIMQEEDYTYIFDTPSGSRVFSSYYEGKNNEWFKVLNVSLGVQYQLAPRWQVQVEPFLKAPLAGVGEWEVTLSSIGMFMGLKYKIN